MSRSHQNSELLLANKPIVIDSPQSAYWSFNHNLVSQGRQLYPLVAQDATLYNGDGANLNVLSTGGTPVEGQTQRYESASFLVPGKFHSGLARNEFTTNIFSSLFDCTFESLADGDTASFTNQLGTGGVLGVVSTMGHDSKKSLNILNGTGASNRTYRTTPIIAGEWLTFSAWVHAMAPGPQLSVEYNGGSYSWAATSSTPHTGSGWELLSVTYKEVAASNATAYCFIYPRGVNIYVDDMQVEKKAYRTTFINGVRPETYLTYPAYQTKTFSCWVKSTSNKQPNGVEPERVIISQSDINNTLPTWRLYAANLGNVSGHPTGTAVLEIIVTGPTRVYANIPSVNILDGEWHQITVSHTGSTSCIYVDGIRADTPDLSSYDTNFAGYLRIGYDSTTNAAGNFIIDEMRVDSKVYSDRDIMRRFMTNTEYYSPFGYEYTCTM